MTSLKVFSSIPLISGLLRSSLIFFSFSFSLLKGFLNPRVGSSSSSIVVRTTSSTMWTVVSRASENSPFWREATTVSASFRNSSSLRKVETYERKVPSLSLMSSETTNVSKLIRWCVSFIIFLFEDMVYILMFFLW